MPLMLFEIDNVEMQNMVVLCTFRTFLNLEFNASNNSIFILESAVFVPNLLLSGKYSLKNAGNVSMF